MSKWILPAVWPEPPDILGVVMSYEQFIDILADAWLIAEDVEGGEVNATFRKGLFYMLDKLTNERQP